MGIGLVKKNEVSYNKIAVCIRGLLRRNAGKEVHMLQRAEKQLSGILGAVILAGSLLITGCHRQEIIFPTAEELQEESSENSRDRADSAQKDRQEANSREEKLPEERSENGRAQDGGQQLLAVHICGAVKEPGVYEVEEGSRIADALELAGGFTDTADLSAVNLAMYVTDGSQVVIPTREESAENKVRREKLVNLNTATAEELCGLPGIGESRAEAIIAYREAHGGFASTEELMQVSGIKEASYQKLKDKVRTE